MAHKLEKLLGSRINNVPALIMEDNLREIVSYLESRDSPSAGISQEETNRRKMSMTDDIAMIPITGALTYESNFMSALCGMTSYQGLLADVEKAAKAGIKTFVLDADSGGGEAFAMMSTADSIRKRVDEVGGRIITYVDGTCASACFGLTAISDEIIAHHN
jgi:ClpP class serine protease